nr:hypothetical protein [Tanacetum cinerariifolium]
MMSGLDADLRAFNSRNLIADAASSLGEDCWELNVRSIPTSSAFFPLPVMCSHCQKMFPLLEESSHCQKKFPLSLVRSFDLQKNKISSTSEEENDEESSSSENEPCCSKDCKKNTDILNSKINELKSKLSESIIYRYSYKLGVDQLEGRLVKYREREVKYIEKIRTLEIYRESNLERIKILTNEVETLKEEKDVVDGKLARLLKSSKDLENIIESQRSKKVKEGVGYNAVPPPAADLYRSPKKYLSWTGLPEFADDTVTNYSRPSPTIESTLAEGQNKQSTTAENGESTDRILSKPAVKFVKAGDRPAERPTTNKAEFVKAAKRTTTDKVETAKKPAVRYAEMYRRTLKRSTVRGNQRNWNNLKSYQLGPEFVLHKKPCFNCGDFSHLANDCRRRVQKETTRSQNHAYKSPPLRPAGHRPHGPPMRPMRSNMNGVKRTSAVRPQYRAPWVPTVNRNFPHVNRKLPTSNSNVSTVCCCCSRHVNTARPKAVINGRNRVKDVQASTCWVWKSVKPNREVPTARAILPLLVKKCSHCRVDELPLLKSLHCW